MTQQKTLVELGKGYVGLTIAILLNEPKLWLARLKSLAESFFYQRLCQSFSLFFSVLQIKLIELLS